jgi:hypothetical protein
MVMVALEEMEGLVLLEELLKLLAVMVELMDKIHQLVVMVEF